VIDTVRCLLTELAPSRMDDMVVWVCVAQDAKFLKALRRIPKARRALMLALLKRAHKKPRH
jgi:hypothetical protein